MDKSRISVIGLGYVGCVSAGCLAKNGNKVIGVDVEQHKVDLINEGTPTIIEKDIDTIIKSARETNRLEATTDIDYAIQNTDISLIAVGTPSTENGSLNLKYIYNVSSQIGQALRNKNSFHVIAVRSTVPPGTNDEIAEIIEKESGKKKNADFGIVMNPEFLREGTSVQDYYNPAFTLLGSDSDLALGMMEKIYLDIDAPIYKTNYTVAEIFKYVCNSFHALKVTFGNEVGNICKMLGIDSHEVMEIFCKDDKLNISSYYLKPGFAYGGSCLPKDLDALINLSNRLNLDTPVLKSIPVSNGYQKEVLLNKILKTGRKNIGILGLSFKAGTDDLRESPILDVVERLVGKGFKIKIYDKNVELSRLIGSNKSTLDQKHPHLAELITDLPEVISESEVIVVVNKEKEFSDIFNLIKKYQPAGVGGGKALPEEKQVIDLVRILDNDSIEGNYEGLCW